jgi:hypothetical protein
MNRQFGTELPHAAAIAIVEGACSWSSIRQVMYAGFLKAEG